MPMVDLSDINPITYFYTVLNNYLYYHIYHKYGNKNNWYIVIKKEVKKFSIVKKHLLLNNIESFTI